MYAKTELAAVNTLEKKASEKKRAGESAEGRKTKRSKKKACASGGETSADDELMSEG